MNNLEGQDLLNRDIRSGEGWFEDIQKSLLKYRDDMSKKLTEIKMSLQRPRIPMIGLSPALNPPYSFDNFGNRIEPYPNEFNEVQKRLMEKEIP